MLSLLIYNKLYITKANSLDIYHESSIKKNILKFFNQELHTNTIE